MRSIDDYEATGRPFETQFPGRCALNWDHKIKRGEVVTRIQRKDNPLLTQGGVACSRCTKVLPRAVR